MSEVLFEVLVSKLARELPSDVLKAFCDRLDNTTATADHQNYSVMFTNAETRHIVQQLLASSSHLNSRELAAWLRGAACVHREYQDNPSIEVVWTGPRDPSCVFRRTDQAVLEVIEGSKRELILVTYAAYRLPIIYNAMISALERGVAIHFIGESTTGEFGTSAVDAIRDVQNVFGKSINIWIWPESARPRGDRGEIGVLHAKLAIADGEAMFVTSANLTERAHSLNFEVGLLVKGGAAPRAVAEELRGLMRNDVFGRP
ncbi:MAG: endonuclease [Planctomycetes bacterium]|nr:endonuclease [Planctomycetota bacterium]